jgi:peptide/nickel transport system substrate-binding protein
MFRSAAVVRSLILATALFAACAPAAPTRSNQPGGSGSSAPAPASVPQRQLVIGFATEPQMMEPSFGQGSGNRDFSALTSAFLAYLTPQQQPMPYLAQELPTVERGTWKVFPDGHMETTYKLRPNLTWHDGRPLTAHDFVFGHTMHLDPAMPTAKIDVDRRIGRAQALDDTTLFLEWKEPYLWGGMIFEPNFPALPRHLLEQTYTGDKQAFVEGAHWRTEFVGNGPYRLESWNQGVDMTLRAFDGFVFGKPPIDRIVMRFITDANTIVANLLTGTVDAAFHSSIAFSENQALEERGWAGHVEYWRGNPRWIEFQTRDWGNIQRVVLDARVRKALMHAINRQAIVEGLYYGKTQAMYYWLSVDDPAYPAVDRAAPKYQYDPRQAEALLQEAGFTKGGDGVARAASGDTLSIPMLNQSGDIDQLEAAIVQDFWRGAGATSEIQRLSRAQQADGEFRSKYAGVAYNRRPLGYDTMGWLSTNTTTPENRWSGDNMSGYVNSTLDQAWPKVLATIDPKDREPLLVAALSAMASDAVVNPTHLQPRSMAYRNGLTGPKEPWVGESALVWNVWEWRWTE